jgi:hypothetical protein
MKLILSLLLVSLSLELTAQELGSWNVIDFRKNTDKKISYQLEAQLRSLKFYSNFHYNELNFTTNYRYDNNLVLSVLLGKHNTYTEGGDFLKPLITDEFRQSIQAATTQKFGPFVLDNRYRIEQRYFLTTEKFNYRMRYRFGLQTNIAKNVKAQFSNEFFLSIGGTNSTFEKNRFLFGIRHIISKQYELQINYLNQIDNRKNDESGSNFLQIVHIINF